ncbi:hypothetical protein ACHAW5_008468 [Stephanodiscus triporus]|uniref:EF-hand domain-containing protein n=1 Tax=Stephanodiscus triporus TaxID=2934178 RepID=A0ABD3PEF5_9STRA
MTRRRISAVVAVALIEIGASCYGFSPSSRPPPPPRLLPSSSSSSSPTARTMIGESDDGKGGGGINVDDPYADGMFARFDSDGNGYIDREEFRAVARKMRSSSRRREVLSVATASFGSIFVASGSNTFQLAQKNLRGRYLEEYAESSMNELFPTAMLSRDVDEDVWRVLRGRGFTPENTLLGHSVCPDEVNNRKEQLIPLMVDRWQEENAILLPLAHFLTKRNETKRNETKRAGFALGGLGGLPFAGKSGFGAYLHHVPDGGRLLVIFAPHVGIDEIGRVGSLQRDGQAKVSSACGAAVGAYKELQRSKRARPDPLLVMDVDGTGDDYHYHAEFDPQLRGIVSLLAPRLGGVEESADSIAFVTYQMYGIIRELIAACIVETADLFDYATEVAVVGGIMINRRKGGDFFQPLSFETRRKGGAPVDLFEEAFGDRPNLLPIIGSKAAMARASLY